MEYARILIIFLLIITLTSCSKRRIDLIEESFHISLPNDYKVVKKTTESSGLAGSDFEINVQLEFDSKSFEDLERELGKIENLKEGNRYYKELEKGEISSLTIDRQERKLDFQLIHL